MNLNLHYKHFSVFEGVDEQCYSKTFNSQPHTLRTLQCDLSMQFHLLKTRVKTNSETAVQASQSITIKESADVCGLETSRSH